MNKSLPNLLLRVFCTLFYMLFVVLKDIPARCVLHDHAEGQRIFVIECFFEPNYELVIIGC
jgi:hypothetical protein